MLEGTLGLKTGRKKIEAGPGEVVTVEPGVAHKFYNAGDGEARFLCRVSPALRFEQLIETMFGLAADSKTSRKGMPNPIRLTVIARHHFDDVRLPRIPHALQRAALAVGAPFGRALGTGRSTSPRARRKQPSPNGRRKSPTGRRMGPVPH